LNIILKYISPVAPIVRIPGRFFFFFDIYYFRRGKLLNASDEPIMFVGVGPVGTGP